MYYYIVFFCFFIIYKSLVVLVIFILLVISVIISLREKDKPLLKSLTKYKFENNKNIDIEKLILTKYTKNSIITPESTELAILFYLSILSTHFHQLLIALTILLLPIYKINNY